MDVGIPSLPIKPPPYGPPLLDEFFFRPTLILRRPDHNGDYTTFPDEAWFYVNGILTNEALAQINAAYISDLFHRPVTIIQNTTNSFVVDLLECALGKEWRHEWTDITEAAQKAFPPIYEALKTKHKNMVVLLCHSQGTIIMSLVLTMLKALVRSAPGAQTICVATDEATSAAGRRPAPGGVPTARGLLPATFTEAPVLVYPYAGIINVNDFAPLSEQELTKLEIYCFANCANLMTYWKPAGYDDRPVPWIESFGNELDIVARLGMFAPRAAHWGITIDGPVYMRKGAWGHLLNEHYLKSIEKAQRVRLKKGGQGQSLSAPYTQLRLNPSQVPIPPRLFTYINGGSPK